MESSEPPSLNTEAMPPTIPASWKNVATNIAIHTQTIHETLSRGPGTEFIASSIVTPRVIT